MDDILKLKELLDVDTFAPVRFDAASFAVLGV